jgi:Tfp pilus assembly pilus retraction ATPase PilT
MINNSSIKNNIKKKDINQLDNIIWTSNNYWMITMKQYAELLIQKWIINKTDVEWLYDLWLWNKNI